MRAFVYFKIYFCIFIYNVTCFCYLMCNAEEADVGDEGHEKTIKNVPESCVSVGEQNETSENKTSVSTEGPDSSSVTTPDSAGNVDAGLTFDSKADSCSGDEPGFVDTTHLNTDSVTPNPVSPVSSPVHVVRTLITQDDPLGLFTNTVTSTSSKMTADPRTSRSSDDVIETARMEEESVLMRRISEDTIGRTSWVAAATDSSLRKCSSLNRLSSEGTHRGVSAPRSTAVSQVASESDGRPSSASPRTSLLGGTFRSAASRFALKYREIRESMVPPGQPVKVVPPMSSETSQEQCTADVGDATPTAAVTDVTAAEVDSAAVCSEENNDTVNKTMPDITVTMQSGKSRLRVPTALYSPLGTCIIYVIIVLVFLTSLYALQ